MLIPIKNIPIKEWHQGMIVFNEEIKAIGTITTIHVEEDSYLRVAIIWNSKLVVVSTSVGFYPDCIYEGNLIFSSYVVSINSPNFKFDYSHLL